MKKKKYIFLSLLIASSLLMTIGCDLTGANDGNGGDGDTLTPVSYRDLVSITGGTYTQTDSMDSNNSFSHTISDFSLGQYEVTYELWYTVHQWAISNGYTFANAGTEGSAGTAGAAPTAAKYEPVTTVNWRDTIVWLNAYSEMSGYTPCYTHASSTIKDSRDTNGAACDGAVCNWSANGYRLPTEGEWQYAAGNGDATSNTYASGATADYTDATETQKVAWDYDNSVGTTHPVGTTTNSSALTLWDMSGNVTEWCWDSSGDYPTTPQTDYRGTASGNYHVQRGGSWMSNAIGVQIGYRSSESSDIDDVTYGFRFARTN